MKKLQRTAKQLSYQVLDPRTLGRPVHLLPRFTQRLKEHLSEMLHVSVNRRYQSNFQIRDISMAPAEADLSSSAIWKVYASAVGHISVTVERALVISVLSYRYGIANEAVSADSTSALPARTATEERLEGILGCQFADAVAACIDAIAGADFNEARVEHEGFRLLGSGSAETGDAWAVKVRMQDGQGVEGELQLLLDRAWVSRLLEGLAPLREKKTEPGIHAAPIGKRLQLKIVARLLEKEISLGDLEDLKIGSVIPVSLGATDVLIDESRLFTATVAEHNGKLCLTSFQDTD